MIIFFSPLFQLFTSVRQPQALAQPVQQERAKLSQFLGPVFAATSPVIILGKSLIYIVRLVRRRCASWFRLHH